MAHTLHCPGLWLGQPTCTIAKFAPSTLLATRPGPSIFIPAQPTPAHLWPILVGHCRSFCRFPPFFPFSRVGRPVQSCPRPGPNDPAADPAAGRSPHGAPARPAGGHDRRDGTSPPGVRLGHEPYYGEGSACTCAWECLRLRARARAPSLTGTPGTGPPSGGSVGRTREARGGPCGASYTYSPGRLPLLSPCGRRRVRASPV